MTTNAGAIARAADAVIGNLIAVASEEFICSDGTCRNRNMLSNLRLDNTFDIYSGIDEGFTVIHLIPIHLGPSLKPIGKPAVPSYCTKGVEIYSITCRHRVMKTLL